jgi:hypothetical protein
MLGHLTQRRSMLFFAGVVVVALIVADFRGQPLRGEARWRA